VAAERVDTGWSECLSQRCHTQTGRMLPSWTFIDHPGTRRIRSGQRERQGTPCVGRRTDPAPPPSRPRPGRTRPCVASRRGPRMSLRMNAPRVNGPRVNGPRVNGPRATVRCLDRDSCLDRSSCADQSCRLSRHRRLGRGRRQRRGSGQEQGSGPGRGPRPVSRSGQSWTRRQILTCCQRLTCRRSQSRGRGGSRVVSRIPRSGGPHSGHGPGNAR
jgi:hypothetical protein